MLEQLQLPRVSGSVTLVPDCTVYRGTVTITVRNTGSPFDWGNVLVHPPGRR